MEPQGLLHRGDPALTHAHAHRTGVGRETVDIGQFEPGIGDGGQAGVDRQGQRIDHEATPDGRASDARKHRLMLEPLVRKGGRGVG